MAREPNSVLIFERLLPKIFDVSFEVALGDMLVSFLVRIALTQALKNNVRSMVDSLSLGTRQELELAIKIFGFQQILMHQLNKL